MPDLFFPTDGSASTATATRWLKTIGEDFAAGDGVLEFETEDGYLVLEASAGGRLRELHVQPGQTISRGAKIAVFETAKIWQVADAVQADAVQTAKENSMPEVRATSGGKVIPILMPQAGNTMEEGTVVAWRVKEGDQITAGQVICEIETDKATIDFESPDAGRLARIIAPLNQPVAVKKVIALLADNDADVDAYLARSGSPAAASPSKPAETTPAPARNGAKAKGLAAAMAVMTAEGRVKASPAARKLATERGIALAAVGSGSGPGGRILSTDLEGMKTPPAASATSAGLGEIRRPLSKMRRAIGLNLQRSKQTVPHFYVRSTIDADPLLEFYREQKTATGCTLNDVIVLAVGRVMREFPAVRSQIDDNEIVEYPHVNIGIAVGIDEGLVVPVVMQVDTLSLGKLAAETKRVVEQARNGRLENIGKGHFTISNLGMFGVEEFSAIINPPESGILAVSAAREAVVVKNGAMRVGHQMTMTLSADHRIVDGVTAAKFMQRLRAILENPSQELA